MSSSSSSPSSSSSSSIVDSLFQRSLEDLIRSLRSAPPSAEPTVISSALSSIRRELKSTDPYTKSTALLKLTYLSSLHSIPDPSPFASFPALELLASPSFPLKRTAYLFASLHYHPSTTDLLPLATHQLHKDLTSSSISPHASSLALHLLSLAASPDLAAHLPADLALLISSPSRPAIRRRSCSTALSVLALSPASVPVVFPKLVDALSDPATAASAVNAFCQLTAADPKPYLPLAPDFHRILITSSNNWILIKVVKIFARLAPLEPRLANRVVNPICDLICKSVSKSLVFECLRTVLSSFPNHQRAVRIAVDKVKDEFLGADEDPNLRFLGLHALSLLGPKHSWAVEDNREAVIRSLTDPDLNIRREALRLLMRMVFETNVAEISAVLLGYALRSDPLFANEIIGSVLDACGRNFYEIVQDFDWYVSVLGEMARNPHCERGEEIERQMVDIGMRVRDVRTELVRVARDLLIDPALLGNRFLERVLSGAAWVSGEYVEFSKNLVELLEALVQPRTSLLPPLVRAVYVQAMFKVLVYCLGLYIEQTDASTDLEASEKTGVQSDDDDDDGDDDDGTRQKMKAEIDNLTHESIVYMINLVETALGELLECDEVEVHERTRNVLGFVGMLKEIPDWEKEATFKKNSRIREVVGFMKGVFSEELGPISVHAQERVPVPEGITLKGGLTDLDTILHDDGIAPIATSFSLRSHHYREMEEESRPSVESTALLAEHRKRHGLYYLPSEKTEFGSKDYPIANDSPVSDTYSDPAAQLLKLADQTLIPKIAKPAKPRPVVVKLDESDGPSTSLKSVESKDDTLSGAIRDVLLGSKEKVPTSLQKTSEKPSRRKLKGTPAGSESISLLKEDVVEKEQGSSSSRARQHRHGKDRHRSHRGKEESEQIDQKNSLRSDSHHGKQKHKHRQRGDAPSEVVPQAPVIQDFLL